MDMIAVIHQNGEQFIRVKDFQEFCADNGRMREALNWSLEFFLSRDRMNAKVHCAPLRLSPITERVILALGLNSEDFKK